MRTTRLRSCAALVAALLLVLIVVPGCQNTPESQAALDAFKRDAALAKAEVDDLRLDEGRVAESIQAVKDEIEALPEDDASREPLVEKLDGLLDKAWDIDRRLAQAMDFADELNARIQAIETPEDIAPAVVDGATAMAARQWPEYAGIIGLGGTALTGLVGWFRERRRTTNVIHAVERSKLPGGPDGEIRLDAAKLKAEHDRRGTRERVRKARKG